MASLGLPAARASVLLALERDPETGDRVKGVIEALHVLDNRNKRMCANIADLMRNIVLSGQDKGLADQDWRGVLEAALHQALDDEACRKLARSLGAPVPGWRQGGGRGIAVLPESVLNSRKLPCS